MTRALVVPERLVPVIKQAQRRFSPIAKKNGNLVNWQTERQFVEQILAKNRLLQQCEPESIKNAIINVAAIGLSLNPVSKHCALVPRWDSDANGYVCCADPMYQGLIALASDSDSIKSINCEVVRRLDIEEGNFKYVGGTDPHVHFAPNPFYSPEQRGPIAGCFVVTEIEGAARPQVTWMQIDEIHAIRDKYSEAWKNKLKKEAKTPGSYTYGGPWESSDEEMCKKTAIKRASKIWPKRSRRFEVAAQLSNDAEGIRIEPRDTDIDGHAEPVYATNAQLASIRKLIEESHVNPTKVLARFKIEKLEELPRDEVTQCEELLKTAKLTYLLKHATPEDTIYAEEHGLTLEALEGKAADQQSRAQLATKRPE